MRFTKQTAAEVKKAFHSVLGDKWEEWEKKRKDVSYDALAEALRGMAPPTNTSTEEKGMRAGKLFRAVAAGRTYDGTLRHVKDVWKDEEFTKELEGGFEKALEAGDSTAGGLLVPTELSSEVVELLREQAVFRGAGPRIVPMPTGALQIPKLTGGATATYIGESQNIGVTQQTFGMMSLSWKKLACIVPMSNDLLRFSTYGVDSMVRDDTVGAMALREDQAFLRGDGTEHTPRGLRYQVSTASPDHVVNSAGKTLANTATDFMAMVLAMRNAYVRFLKPAFFMSYRSKLFLQFILDSNGNKAYPEIAQGNWGGIPLFATTSIPDTIGGSNSEIYLVDLADMIIGESSSMEVQGFDGAAYYDGSAVQSGVSLDQTVLRVLTHHDFGVRHNVSIYVLDAVTYGT